MNAAQNRRAALWLAVLVCLMIAVLAGCTAGSGAKKPADGQITVWADSSLQSRLEPLAGRFTARNGVRVTFRFADTASLARQAEVGGSADLLIFDGEAPMKQLYKAQTVDNYNLFAFSSGGRVYSIAKPMNGRNYWYAQQMADTVTAGTESVSGSNPNL